MISYISNFKAIFLALFIIILIEVFLVLFFSLDYERIREKTNLESLYTDDYLGKRTLQKYIVGIKYVLFEDADPEFLQIGDSSGFYGIQPNIIKEYIGNRDYINTNCCGDMGWDGYLYMAQAFLQKSKNIEYLILHVSPYTLPAWYGSGFSNDIYRSYTSYWNFYNYFPSLYFKSGVINFVFRKKNTENDKSLRQIKEVFKIDSYEEFTLFLKKSTGWLPYDEMPGKVRMPIEECGQDIKGYAHENGELVFAKYLQKIKDLADKYSVKLIIIFNPVACSGEKNIRDILMELQKFKNKNPDVYIPFSFINTQVADDFSDQWHLTPEASVDHSHKVGKILKKLLENEAN